MEPTTADRQPTDAGAPTVPSGGNSAKTSPSDPAGEAAAVLDLYRTTLHAAGIPTAGLSPDRVREAYREFAERRERDRAEAMARQRREAVEAAHREATDRRRARAENTRRYLIGRGIDPKGMDDDAVMVRAKAVHESEEQKAAEARHRQAADARFKSAGCPELHAGHMDLPDPKENPEWFALRDRLAGKLTDGFLVALLGLRGTGKTQLAVAVIHAASEAGLSSRYVKRRDLSRLIRRTFAPVAKGEAGESEDDVVEELAGYELLVIDEVHQAAGTDFDRDTLTDLLDRRYDAMRATVLIANQDRKDFAATVGDSIVSRIHETGEVIECEWASYRKPGMWDGAAR